MNRNENSTRPREGQQSKQMHYSPNLMGTINNAIIEKKILNIEYDSREKGITHRDIEPMAIVYNKGKRNLVGWCNLRNDWRSFRLDRLNCIKLNLSASFNPRPDFKIEDFEDNEAPQEHDMLEDREDRDYGRDHQRENRDHRGGGNRGSASNNYSRDERITHNTYGKTMSENKLNFSGSDSVKKYSEDEGDLSL